MKTLFRQALLGGRSGRNPVVGFLLTFAAGAAFGIVTEVVFATSLSKEIDAAALLWLQRFQSPLLTRLMLLASFLGHPLVLNLLASALGLFLIYRRQLSLLAVELLAWLGGGALDLSLKELFHRLRPPADLQLISAAGHSYPSGHAFGSLLFFGGLIYLLSVDLHPRSGPFRRRGAVLLCFLIVFFVGISRVYLGIHYLSDVVGGWIAALFWLGVCLNVAEAFRMRRNRRRREALLREWPPEPEGAPGPFLETVVLVNAEANVLARQDHPEEVMKDLVRMFEAEGMRAAFWAVRADRIGAAARLAVERGAKILVAAGGDGTIGAAGAAAAGAPVRLGIVPLGTLNHFARDLEIPFRPDEAVRAIARGVARRVDVGEVNGRLFVNNASIGFYARMVHKRDEIRERLGYRKWRAMLRAGLFVFRRFPRVTVRVKSGGGTRLFRTPLLFIGNNEYPVNLLRLGKRSSLEEGKLSIYAVRCERRLEFILLSLRALLGRLRPERDFQSLTGRALSVHSVKGRLRVALDGECVVITPPLHFRIRPGALRVIVPERGEMRAPIEIGGAG